MSKARRSAKRGDAADSQASQLRIIGGSLGGRKLTYHGNRVTRPMKDRTREAIFNLINTDAQGRHAIDLFAGTGALGLEALSRGASGATFIEKHVPTARVLQENIDALKVTEQSAVLVTSAFLWGRRDLPRVHGDQVKPIAIQSTPLKGAIPPVATPWLVFCSPPYSFYRDRWDELSGLLVAVRDTMPAGSLLVVEADQQFDFAKLGVAAEPSEQIAGEWRIRTYAPAVVGVYRSR